MMYLLLATGQIATSELASLSQQPCSVHDINPTAEQPLTLFSLLLSEVKLFDEATGDELAPVTAVVHPEGPHTALLFDQEQAMIRAKLLLHGLDDTQWSRDTNFTHSVRFSGNVSNKQLNEVALLGTQLCRLMAAESPDSLLNDTASDSLADLEQTISARVQISKQLIGIQAQFGICPCTG
ncbi:MAG: hypothetical protein V7629_15795 [Motiliproteus sp.]